MREYIATADCLVDDCLLHYTVVARNIREAWIKAYVVAMKSPVIDSGSVDVERKQYNSKENKSWK